MTLSRSLQRPAARRASSLRSFWIFTRCETLKALRNPAFMVPILAMPIMLFLVFGLPSIGTRLAGGQDAGVLLMVGYGAYAVMMVGLFSFGLSISVERESNWLTQLRATPLRPGNILAAKLLVAVLVATAAVILLFASGIVLGGVRLALLTWLSLWLRLMLAMLPFVVLGFWIGYSFAPNAAAGVANLILLPLAFASGLFVPMEVLPGFMRSAAPYLPSYHGGQIAFDALGWDDGSGFLMHALWLLAYTAAFALLTALTYRRSEGRSLG